MGPDMSVYSCPFVVNFVSSRLCVKIAPVRDCPSEDRLTSSGVETLPQKTQKAQSEDEACGVSKSHLGQRAAGELPKSVLQ
jgi:hypothetical protein